MRRRRRFGSRPGPAAFDPRRRKKPHAFPASRERRGCIQRIGAFGHPDLDRFGSACSGASTGQHTPRAPRCGAYMGSRVGCQQGRERRCRQRPAQAERAGSAGRGRAPGGRGRAIRLRSEAVVLAVVMAAAGADRGARDLLEPRAPASRAAAAAGIVHPPGGVGRAGNRHARVARRHVGIGRCGHRLLQKSASGLGR